jgi:hypothetical protein
MATTQDAPALLIAEEQDGSLDQRRNAEKRQTIKTNVIQRVREVVATLSPALRDVANAWLRAVESERSGGVPMSWASVAVELGIRVPTAKVRWHRARNELGQRLPAWRDLFPIEPFCDEHDQYAAVLDQNYEKRRERANRFAADLIEDRDDWIEAHGCDTPASAEVSSKRGARGGELSFRPVSRGCHGEYPRQVASFQGDTHLSDDEGPYQGLSLMGGGRGKRRPGVPRNINKDMRCGSVDYVDAVCREMGQRLYKVSPKHEAASEHDREKAEQAKARMMPDPDVPQDEFREVIRAMDERRGKL